MLGQNISFQNVVSVKGPTSLMLETCSQDESGNAERTLPAGAQLPPDDPQGSHLSPLQGLILEQLQVFHCNSWPWFFFQIILEIEPRALLRRALLNEL